MPLISIVIPTFNRADLIGETLDGVRAQTVGDWECSIIDDGSTDNTRAVVEAFAARDARFRYVALGKFGHEAAWTRGAALSTGTYMALLDSDDVWSADFLEKMVALLRSDPGAVLAAAPHWAWDGNSILYTQEFDARKRANPRAAMIRQCFVFPSQCLFVRATLAKTKGFRRFPSDDYDIWMQLLPHGRMILADEPLVKYRRHPGGDSYTPGFTRALQYCRNDIWILTQFARQPGLSPFERVLALANVQRKHELLLETEMQAGIAPRSWPVRLGRLLSIVPTPLLRSPRLGLRYLRGDGRATKAS